jgi:predicted kinase
MPPIFLIAGSPASGKSTIARLLAQRAAKGLHIPVDDLRTMVHGGVVHPGPAWSADLIEQLDLARKTAADMALRYHRAGFLVAIDDFFDPYSNLAEYETLYSAEGLHRIILMPHPDVAIARLRERQPHSGMRDLMEEAIRDLHEKITALEPTLTAQSWQILDTSTGTPGDHADHILALNG